ncbi:MAG: type II toxin-antitoxin system VapC family toxin [Candidatus Shapirobacteria bacterium]|jgi:hypothetical protein
MVKIVVDSSVIIEKIRTDGCLFDRLVELQLKNKVILFISVVTVAELWAGESMNKKSEIESVTEIIKYIKRLIVNEDIAMMSGEIVRKYKIEAMDALIAASALEDDAQLATLNVKHFKMIKGLKLYK